MFRKYGTDTYKTSDRNLLRHLTVPGQRVSFYLRTYTDILEKKPAKYKVEGTVTAVYPHIFFLDDGKCYQWTDYLLGYIY